MRDFEDSLSHFGWKLVEYYIGRPHFKRGGALTSDYCYRFYEMVILEAGRAVGPYSAMEAM